MEGWGMSALSKIGTPKVGKMSTDGSSLEDMKLHGETTRSSGKEGYGGGKDGEQKDAAFIYQLLSVHQGLGYHRFLCMTAWEPVSSNKLRMSWCIRDQTCEC